MKTTAVPSPNHNNRPQGLQPDTVIIHYTGMKTADEALARLVNAESMVSAHYLINESGEIFTIVADESRAWHAGVSHWKGRDNVNDFSVGIELANLGHEFGYQPFPDAQMRALYELCGEIKSKWNIPAANFIAHSDIAPSRKEDPGELFNWHEMAARGFGIWPSKDFPLNETNAPIARAGESGANVAEFKKLLRGIGYKISESNTFDIDTVHAVVAFRRKYTPEILHPLWDKRCHHIINLLYED